MPVSAADRLERAAAAWRVERSASLHALHVLEYALSAPAPRRQRTWLHRVSKAVESLEAVLRSQMESDERAVGLLAEIARADPRYAAQVHKLGQEHVDLRIAAASIREQIEPDPEFPIDPADIRDRLAGLTRRYRQHRARESDLVYEAVGIEPDDPTAADPTVPSGESGLS